MSTNKEHYLIKLSKDIPLSDFFVNKMKEFNFEEEAIINRDFKESLINATYISYEPLCIEEEDEIIYMLKTEVEFTIDINNNYLYYLAEERNEFFEEFLNKFFGKIETVNFNNYYFKKYLLNNKMLAPIQVHIQVMNNTFIKDVDNINYENSYDPLSQYKKNSIDADIKKLTFLYHPDLEIRFTIYRQGKVVLNSKLAEKYPTEILRFLIEKYDQYLKGVDCLNG